MHLVLIALLHSFFAAWSGTAANDQTLEQGADRPIYERTEGAHEADEFHVKQMSGFATYENDCDPVGWSEWGACSGAKCTPPLSPGYRTRFRKLRSCVVQENTAICEVACPPSPSSNSTSEEEVKGRKGGVKLGGSYGKGNNPTTSVREELSREEPEVIGYPDMFKENKDYLEDESYFNTDDGSDGNGMVENSGNMGELNRSMFGGSMGKAGTHTVKTFTVSSSKKSGAPESSEKKSHKNTENRGYNNMEDVVRALIEDEIKKQMKKISEVGMEQSTLRQKPARGASGKDSLPNKRKAGGGTQLAHHSHTHMSTSDERNKPDIPPWVEQTAKPNERARQYYKEKLDCVPSQWTKCCPGVRFTYQFNCYPRVYKQKCHEAVECDQCEYGAWSEWKSCSNCILNFRIRSITKGGMHCSYVMETKDVFRDEYFIDEP